ncbi:MAG: TIGR00282 family metallophosphoesterase [Spirochaetota bacterium]
MRVLFIAEIVGKAGVYCVKTLLPDLRKELDVDFVIANGDGATGGFGIGKNHAIYLRKLGVDVITGGEQMFFKKDMVPHIDSAYYVLRPANYPPSTPGRGWRYYDITGDSKIAVISILGQSGFERVHASNPFTYLPDLASRARNEAKYVVVDFHATTTAEKYTMFHHADGEVSAIVGTGTRVQTADAQIMPKGTAVIGDAGRTGSFDSVSGLDPRPEIRKFVTGVPERSSDTWVNLELQAVLLEFGDDGKATSITPVKRGCEGADHD